MTSTALTSSANGTNGKSRRSGAKGSIVGNSANASKNARPKNDRHRKKGASNSVESIVKKIRELQQKEAVGRIDLIRRQVEIGEQLQALRDRTKHGQWASTLKQLCIDERRAQRLMKLARSPLAGEIRPTGTDFDCKLPVELQKLVTLIRLSGEQLREFLSGNDVDVLSRKELAALIREYLGESEPKPKSKDRTARLIPTKEGVPSHGADNERHAPGAVSQSAGDHSEEDRSTNPVGSNCDLNIETRAADHKRHVELFRRITSGSQHEKDRTAMNVVAAVFESFEAEVVRDAKRIGRIARDQADLAPEYDEKLFGMLLLNCLKESLAPEHAYAPKLEAE